MHRTASHLGLALAVATGLLSPDAGAHAERRSFFPVDRVADRPAYRPLLPTPASPRLVVCKQPGDEGIGEGQDSAARIATMDAGARKTANEQLLAECQFEHLQAAVDAVTERGTTIYVLPGIYLEQPSVRALDERAGATTEADTEFCQAVLDSGAGALSYEQQFRCRHIQNTIAIFGDPDFTDDDCGDDIEGVCANPLTQACDTAVHACQYYDLQIEGTGARKTDVIFEGDFIDAPGDDAVDGQFRYLNGIRADRVDGLFLKNFTTQIYEFNSVYILECDGVVMEDILARWVDEYSFLSFASDHVLYERCGGYGAADSVLYPGSGADIYKDAMHADADLRARQGTEIRNSFGTHAAGGYSGTAGNSPWVHDNVFYKNQTGLATESIFGGHPGMPQDHGLFENNLVYNNNKNYFQFVEEDGPCIAQTPRDRGVVPPEYREFDDMPSDMREAILDRMVLCPGIPFPTGTGMIIGGGNYNVMQNNEMFDHWAYGYIMFSVPTAVRYTEDDPNEYLAQNPNDNAHFNRYLNNQFAGNSLVTPTRLQPNQVDFWYDNSGVGNCYDGNTSADPQGVTEDTGDPVQTVPGGPCTDGPLPNGIEQAAAANNARIGFLASCIAYSRDDPSSKSPECPFFDPLVAPEGREGASTALSRRPVRSNLAVGASGEAGYFVLNNDTGDVQMLSEATIDADGSIERLAGLTLSVTVAHDGQVQSFEAAVESIGTSNTFTFDPAVPLPPLHMVLFNLSAEAAPAADAAAGPRADLMLASGAGSLAFASLLFVGGPGRRRLAGVLLVVAAAGLLHSCNSGGGGGGATTVIDDPVPDLDDGGEEVEITGDPVTFTLGAVTVDAGGESVSYDGLPLEIGEIGVN